MTLGVDVGGTFTDVVWFDGESIMGRKVPTTTPQDRGVVVGIQGVPPGASFLHGTTVATNQLLEEKGARVTLVTSEGFEDIIEIGRQARPSLYDPFVDRPGSLVPRERRIGFAGDPGGLVAAVQATDPGAVAVALVRSYAEPSLERELAQRLQKGLGIPVSVGADVSPAFREYERVASTVLNAYLSPTVTGYLGSLDEALSVPSKMVMTSAGGLLPFATAASLAGRLVLSGPAAGVVAAAQLGRARGFGSVISFDMGGTSTDVCRIEGIAPAAGSHRVAGRINRVPSMPVRTIGAGGGSIAWADAGGALRVGPMSAGAEPGPASYGLGGTQPTVTDANLVLGAIPQSVRLGGRLALDPRAARAAVGVLGGMLDLSSEDTASGIVAVVDNHMERALRAVSIEEGADPRESALVAFGGAGGLHATRLARSLGMRHVLIPPLSGVFSALGLLLAHPTVDASRTVLLEEGSPALGEAARALGDEARSGFSHLHAKAPDAGSLTADVRYVGQSHELTVPLSGGWEEMRRSFEETHSSRFGFARPDEPIELVNLRAVAAGPAPLSWDALPLIPTSTSPRAAEAVRLVEGSEHKVDIWERATLPAGFECQGPALVVEKDSAICLEPGDRLAIEDDGTIHIEL